LGPLRSLADATTRYGCAQVWPWGWCVVNSTRPTSQVTADVGGVEFTTPTITGQVVRYVAASTPDGLPVPTT
ncbi:MAG: hypothetical protein ACRDQZ_09335, partial [Mycobacteriales bacterium]